MTEKNIPATEETISDLAEPIAEVLSIYEQSRNLAELLRRNSLTNVDDSASYKADVKIARLENLNIDHQKPNIPRYETVHSAGCDLQASGTYIINPRRTVKVSTGIALEIPPYLFGAIFARSGMATKQGLRPANCVGVIDSDYRGEIIVALHNDSDQERIIENGERIAQLVLLPCIQANFQEVEYDELQKTERGTGGFGSTGS